MVAKKSHVRNYWLCQSLGTYVNKDGLCFVLRTVRLFGSNIISHFSWLNYNPIIHVVFLLKFDIGYMLEELNKNDFLYVLVTE